VIKGKRIVCRCEFEARAVPKGAGFRWDPAAREWWTDRPSIALAVPGQTATITALLKHMEHQASEAKATAIAASRAIDATVAIPAPEGMEYMPFQKAGIVRALQLSDVLLADEMGLGKTVQLLGVVNASGAKKVLVIAPKIVLRNWVAEARRWTNLSVGIATTKKFPDTDIVITNYDIVAKLRPQIDAITWDIVGYDECHALKNGKATRTKACLGGGRERVKRIAAKRRMFLTGTPILNRTVELYTILKSIGVAGDYYTWTAKYCAGHNSGFGWDATGSSNTAELQDILRERCMIRRLKADVLTELPAKRYQVVPLEVAGSAVRAATAIEKAWEGHQARFQAQVEDCRARGDEASLRTALEAMRGAQKVHFETMSTVRHAVAVAKTPMVIEHAVGLLEGGAKGVLVFAHHIDVIEGIAAGMDAAGYRPAVIHGGTPDKDRAQAIADIQAGVKRVAVLSLTAAGVGVTLTAADVVCHAEMDFRPGIMQQAEDRAHRIGQDKNLLVQYLVVDGSLDAKMAGDLVRKGGVIADTLDKTPDATVLHAACQQN
jgi:SWI/SNF-related matrix-associated actin-dependent regulator 1 of chromatin subfamily A